MASRITATWTNSLGFDSNPTRVEPVSGLPTHPSAFAAGLLGLAAKAFPWRQELTASLDLGGKMHFFDAAQSADLFIVKSHLGWRARAGELTLSLTGSHFESHEATARAAESSGNATEAVLPASLSFRILSAEASAAGSAAANVQVQGGVRWTRFSYFPDATLSYQGLSAFLRLSMVFDLGKETGAHRLTLSTETAAAWNRYPNWPEERSDMAPVLSLDAEYLGWFLMRMSYQLWAEFSSDPTWSSTRHSLTLQAAMALPWQLYVVTRATLQYLDYAKGLLLYTPASQSDFARLDQEGRSSLLLSIQRSLTKRYTVQVRYLFYYDLTAPRESTGHAGRYRRHMVTLDLQAALP